MFHAQCLQSSSPGDDGAVKPGTAGEWKSGGKFNYPLKTSSESKTSSFDASAAAAQKFDENLCKQWGDDIDALLVYHVDRVPQAGLFSAVVTAFAVESTNTLQPDPMEETVRLLTAIANQTTTEPQGDFTPTTTAVTVNVMYFLSLTLSLTSALLSILCKQWIREYQRDYPSHLNSRQKVAVRQSRYEGLQKWRVPGIIAMIPLLLQVATALFFFGLVTMLWDTNHTVAIVIMVPVIVSLLSVVVTTILAPIFLLVAWGRKKSFFWQCPYKTPLGWTIIRMVTPLFLLVHRFLPRDSSRGLVNRINSLKGVIRSLNWSIYDLRFEGGTPYDGSMSRAMTWMYPFQSSAQFSECLKDVKAHTAWNTLRELIPFLKVAKDQKDRISNPDDIEKPQPKETLSLDDLESFVSSVASPDNNEAVKKDVIEVACVLFRRNAPKGAKIKFCLEGCIRIINTARVLPPKTINIVKYLLHTYQGDLPEDIGRQLEATLNSHSRTFSDDDQTMAADINSRLASRLLSNG
ncbi:hypothetical protein VNI00_004341 [Paramarasmius palmivorus]|uniref:DUF6535 domain-containing protein n=1 Tax=Paramarasmius palmivorus TaxID=297713 RepID=A0AAW0DQ77_9AGAR